MGPLIAVIDVGKSNAKLSFVDVHTHDIIWSVKRRNEENHSLPLRQLDIVGIERWLLDMLKCAPRKEQIAVIVPVGHGAAAVLVDENGSILAAADYEDPAFATVRHDYERQRDPFEATFSPNLPLGLNLGRQFHFMDQSGSLEFTRVNYALLYPQYWAWRLCRVMASEVTSLGCHSDLWRPKEHAWSDLAKARKWAWLFPPLRYASDTLGTITGEIAKLTGLNPACRVSCGVHDSNASYLEDLLTCGCEQPFCVISSGTWTVTMANRADLTRLRAGRDMLANVDVFSSPVGTARFMGGREYAAIARGAAVPNRAAVEAVLRRRSMALPSFATGGPFPSAKGMILRGDNLDGPERAALATLYVALMSDLSVDLLGAAGDIFLDGPLAQNSLFGPLLAALHPHSRVLVTGGSGAYGAAVLYLAGYPDHKVRRHSVVEPLKLPGLGDYRGGWRERLPR